MIDSRLYLKNYEAIKLSLLKRGVTEQQLKELYTSLNTRNKAQISLDRLRTKKNQLQKSQVKLKDPQTDLLRKSQAEIKQLIKIQKNIYDKEKATASDLLLKMPNIPHESSVSNSHFEVSNRTLFANVSSKEIKNIPHWITGKQTDILDEERSRKISGSSFSVLKNSGAKLVRALVNFSLDIHSDHYQEIILPELVLENSLIGSGHLPKFYNQAYAIKDTNLWLVPTAEVPLTAFHKGEKIPVSELPLGYISYTRCFRKEVGSGGKITSGMQRLHEYHQVELYRYCLPEDSLCTFDSLLDDALKCLIILNLQYRVTRLLPHELPFSATRAYKVEVFSPGVESWLQVSTVSDFGDFQSRRSNIKFQEGAESGYLNTMNASALAVSRVWGILIETGLKKDGTIQFPEALSPYLKKGGGS